MGNTSRAAESQEDDRNTRRRRVAAAAVAAAHRGHSHEDDRRSSHKTTCCSNMEPLNDHGIHVLAPSSTPPSSVDWSSITMDHITFTHRLRQRNTLVANVNYYGANAEYAVTIHGVPYAMKIIFNYHEDDEETLMVIIPFIHSLSLTLSLDLFPHLHLVFHHLHFLFHLFCLGKICTRIQDGFCWWGMRWVSSRCTCL